MSNPTKLRISNIQSFESSQNEIIVGETFELTCTVIGKEVPDFRITNDGRFLDASRYSIISKSVESPNELLHLAKFKITTKVATVIQGGQDFYCSVRETYNYLIFIKQLTNTITIPQLLLIRFLSNAVSVSLR